MEVILIRHTSVDVPKGVCYGQTDVLCEIVLKKKPQLRLNNYRTTYLMPYSQAR